MKNRIYMRALCVRGEGEGEGVEEAAAGSPIRFVASTQGVKRDGKDLDVRRWRTDNYANNPVFLWVHDYFGRTLPIGRGTNVALEEGQMKVDVLFDQEDEFARQVEGKYRRGFLNAVSVGWGKFAEGKESVYDLLDISAVPVPGDPEALMERALWDEMRAGAVLSTRNRGDLENAVALIEGVLVRAKKEAAAEEGEGDEEEGERGEGLGALEMSQAEALEVLKRVSEKINQISILHLGGA